MQLVVKPVPDTASNQCLTESCAWHGFDTNPPFEDIVELHYTGYHEKKKFASSREDLGEPLRTEIGTGKVIKGWDEGIVSMFEGEIARLVIRDDFAYGAYGYPPMIPGGATLTYEIELLRIEKPTSNHKLKPSH
ncbi:hypothetical protein CPB83DRAFT_895538 [Crepidotus variabilis]|uniref:peptidylprolyl isomerase n=1 Tax=Crepidotus variabilis TaxID=179855 RepID=A0A9P6ECW0_9AGAR|nr:hypothetical protein CPB83DRAFT_895538 [Crepidotus variabilis]